MENPIRDTSEEFLDLLEPQKADLLRFCRALATDRDTAKDLASEAILIAFERFESIKDRSQLKSYLYTTASRLARTERKLGKRNASYADASSLHYDDAAPDVLADIHL